MIHLVLVLRGLCVEGLSVLIRYGSGSDLLLPRGWSREGRDAVVGGGGGALRLMSQGSHGHLIGHLSLYFVAEQDSGRPLSLEVTVYTDQRKQTSEKDPLTVKCFILVDARNHARPWSISKLILKEDALKRWAISDF
jgi:hypothetical protein